MVEPCLQELGDDPGLEKRASVRVDEELLGILYADEVGREPGVAEKELGRFGETFTEVSVVCRQ